MDSIWSRVSEFKLFVFTDSDFAGYLDNRKSSTSNVFSIGLGAVTWSSKKQAITTLSSSKAKHVAATSTSWKAVWLRRLLADLHQAQRKATEIFCDTKPQLQ